MNTRFVPELIQMALEARKADHAADVAVMASIIRRYELGNSDDARRMRNAINAGIGLSYAEIKALMSK